MNPTVSWAAAAAVAGGAAVGALGRWGAGLWLNARWPGFPLGTLFVNLLGGLLMGMALAWLQQRQLGLVQLFVMTGVLGGFTTFSAFSAESLALLSHGQWGMAMAHTLAHVLGALVCAAVGLMLVRAVLSA